MVCLAANVFSLCALTSPGVAAARWKSYFNDRYGFASTLKITYPKTVSKVWNANTTRIAKSFIVTSCSEEYDGGCA